MASELVPEDGQLSLVLSSPRTESADRDQGDRSTSKKNRLDSPLQQRLRDFDSDPMVGIGDQKIQSLPQPCPVPKPGSCPPAPRRQPSGQSALHDVQLGPFEFMASMAREEVVITQVDPPDDIPRTLLPTYSSQSATYTQPLNAPEFKQLLPDYSSQTSQEGAHRDNKTGMMSQDFTRSPEKSQRQAR